MTTLLDIVQDMLFSINGDQVSTYTAGNESKRCSRIAHQVFLEFIANTQVEEQEDVIQLDSVGDVLNPTQLLIPSKVDKIVKMEYQDRDGHYRDVYYLDPVEFVDHLDSFRNYENSFEIQYNNVGLIVRTDRQPRHWTTFNDQDVIMDSFEQDVEATLVGSKTRILISYTGPEVWEYRDDFVIPLDDDSLSTYKAECLEMAWAIIKERENSTLRSKGRRERAKLHHRSSVYRQDRYTYADFGRRSNNRSRVVLNLD